jgi:hypothetical protein
MTAYPNVVAGLVPAPILTTVTRSGHKGRGYPRSP